MVPTSEPRKSSTCSLDTNTTDKSNRPLNTASRHPNTVLQPLNTASQPATITAYQQLSYTASRHPSYTASQPVHNQSLSTHHHSIPT
ncbi:hypothetical protein Pmani_009976 [Petrolisthes manimaculis]|uniref:Uncharacterized protein n=1 Tax=Petrolisthes manimaculis TaxID=1843537 RepID=A0AAE1Q3Z4_9EUCA|nr:hypothetical protein Pmani_009976 [Petrolisthes manimaculis]